MTNALEVRGLRKSYGEKAVLKGIDLSVGRGDIFALLGVNGAGLARNAAGIQRRQHGVVRSLPVPPCEQLHGFGPFDVGGQRRRL